MSCEDQTTEMNVQSESLEPYDDCELEVPEQIVTTGNTKMSRYARSRSRSVKSRGSSKESRSGTPSRGHHRTTKIQERRSKQD